MIWSIHCSQFIKATQPVSSQGPNESGFGGFQQYLNDPNAQIGLTVGRNALNYGQEYLGKNVSLIFLYHYHYVYWP